MYYLNKFIRTVCMFVVAVLIAGAIHIPVRASSCELYAHWSYRHVRTLTHSNVIQQFPSLLDSCISTANIQHWLDGVFGFSHVNTADTPLTRLEAFLAVARRFRQ